MKQKQIVWTEAKYHDSRYKGRTQEQILKLTIGHQAVL